MKDSTWIAEKRIRVWAKRLRALLFCSTTAKAMTLAKQRAEELIQGLVSKSIVYDSSGKPSCDAKDSSVSVKL